MPNPRLRIRASAESSGRKTERNSRNMALSQPGIFNALDYGLVAGIHGIPNTNRQALQAAISACQSAGGGTVLIPQEDSFGNTVYLIEGPIDVGEPLSGPNEAVIIAGTAQGQKDGPTLLVEADGTLFSVDTSGGDHIGGITFRDFGVQYDQNPDTGVTYSGTAIDVVSGENVRIERIVFFDCAQAVWFEDTLQCTIFDCLAQYHSIVPNPACITLGNDTSGVAAKEIYIAACTFISSIGGGIGLIIEGSEHVRVMNVRIESFSEGINIIPGRAISGAQNALKHHFGNVTVFTYNPSGLTGPALTIQPQGQESISEVVFAECTFEPSQSGVSSGPGVYIDEGAYGATVTDIRFVSCHVTRWTGPGIEITGGSNIEVIGGLYAANASGSSPSGGSGGISITGPASGIRILGAACIGTYPYIINTGGPTTPTRQDVGIYIAGSGASDVIIDHCDLTGNSQHAVLIGAGGLNVSNVFIRNCNANGYGTLPTDAIDVVGEVSNVEITACAGYNDQAATLSTSAPSGTFSNTSFGYYGPVAFYCSGGTNVTVNIDGNGTGLSSGGFTLSPGETAAFVLGIGGHLPTTFFVVGK